MTIPRAHRWAKFFSSARATAASACRDTGTGIYRPYFQALLAESLGQVGQVDEGLAMIDEAQSETDASGQHCFEAEMYRLKGELLLKQPSPDLHQAETCFHQALDVARQQQAKSLELRAATSLARLWQSQDKRQEAYDLLAPVYEWFTEGFDTKDLQEAKALLAELA